MEQFYFCHSRATCLTICLITFNSDYFTRDYFYTISKGSSDFSTFRTLEFKVEKSIDSSNTIVIDILYHKFENIEARKITQ